jgi:hypothetical protein
VHHHAGRLVEHQQVLVLEEDVERDPFAHDLARDWIRDFHANTVAAFDAVRGFVGTVVDRDAARGNQCRGTRTRQGELVGDEEIEPLPYLLVTNRERFNGRQPARLARPRDPLARVSTPTTRRPY